MYTEGMHLIKTKHLQSDRSLHLVCVCVIVSTNRCCNVLPVIFFWQAVVADIIPHTAHMLHFCLVLLFSVACVAITIACDALKCCLSRQLTCFWNRTYVCAGGFTFNPLTIASKLLIFELQNTVRTTKNDMKTCLGLAPPDCNYVFFLIGVLCCGIEKCCHMEADPTHEARLMTPGPAV